MSHPFVLWVDDEPRQAKNDELLCKVRLEWPRRAAKKALRLLFTMPAAYLRLGLWDALYNVAHVLGLALTRVASKADAAVRRAWHVVDPYAFP
jgi:hypothetical protein